MGGDGAEGEEHAVNLKALATAALQSRVCIAYSVACPIIPLFYSEALVSNFPTRTSPINHDVAATISNINPMTWS